LIKKSFVFFVLFEPRDKSSAGDARYEHRHSAYDRQSVARLRSIHFNKPSAASFAARDPVPGPIPFKSL